MMLNRQACRSAYLLKYICIFIVFVSHISLVQANVVEKNAYDDRTFETITLANGLKVLLIFDPTADKAAAALDVNVGSSYDPVSRQGLAHFLEHMLFLGTDKYPVPGDFQNYISENNGEHNAYTSVSHTNYFFEVEASALDGALDRFSQFFISPQFQSSVLQDEINALDSEYLARIDSDERRQRDVIRSLLVDGHELKKFSTGNAQTLTRATGISGEMSVLPDYFGLRDELSQFFKRHYSADRMTLVVSSPYSISDLRRYVEPKFSQIASFSTDEIAETNQFLAHQTVGAKVEIQSVREASRLSLFFPVPESRSFYEQKPLEFIADVLSGQGEGSLHSLFVNLGWATSINAAVDYFWHGGETFGVHLNLTENGLAQVEMIRQLIFDYVQLVEKKGVSKSRYRELADKGDTIFRFYEKEAVLESVSEFAAQLHYIPAEKLLSSRYLFADYDSKLIRSYLSKLNSENVLTVVTHPYVHIMENVQVSEFYHTKYVVHPRTENGLALGELQQRQLDQYRKQIRLPKSNRYLADELELVKHDTNEIWTQPKVLRSKYGVTTWYMPDTVYRQPFTYIKSQWVLPSATSSARSAVSTQLLTAMLEREISQQLYPASNAGIDFSLTPTLKGIELVVDGFSDNMSRVTRKISGVIGQAVSSRRYRQLLVKKHFNSVYRDMLMVEQNKVSDGAYIKAFRELPETLYRPRWTSNEILAELKVMTMHQFLRNSRELFEGAKADVFIYGNESERSAGRLARYFEKMQRKMGSRPSMAPSLVVDISEENYIYVKSMPVNRGDNALMLYVQGHNDDLKERAKFLMLDQMIRAPFYTTLRTEKQLGYLVQSEQYKLKNVPGLICVVQSPNSTALEIYDSINNFFVDQAATVFDNFYQNRKAVLAKLDQQPQSQSEVSQLFWLSIKEGDTDFNERQKLRDIVENMSIYRMKKFYFSRVLNKSGRVLFVGNDGELNAQSFEKNALLITDALTFKNSMPVYLYP